MSKPIPLLVTAHLSTPLAGDPPMLDAIIEWQLAFRMGLANKYRRDQPIPAPGLIPFAISRRDCGPWPVPLCSSPILSPVRETFVEHFHKRLCAENADLLREESRTVVATTNGAYKSYRLPLRKQLVDCVRWICMANYRELKKQLKGVEAIGKKRSIGNGRVSEWAIEPYAGGDRDCWFAASEAGPVLMRPMPIGDWLPDGLVGARKDFGACCAPYWHPSHYCDIMTPV